MHKAHRILNILDMATLTLGCMAVLLMMLHVSADIVARQVTSWRVPATLETVTYIYMVMIAFLPLAAVQARRQQIAVELFAELLPARVIFFTDALVGLIGGLFVLGLAWFSTALAWEQTLIREAAPSMASPVPIWPVRWMLVLAWVLVSLHLLIQAGMNLRAALTGRAAEFGPAVNAPEAAEADRTGGL